LLRLLEKADLELILPWRNAPEVRLAMYSQHEITWEEHHAWFQRMQSDNCKQWFLHLNKNKEPIGVVYFTDIIKEQQTAFWGFYASPEATPGTGMRMSLDALSYAFNELNLQRLNADVLVSNPRSLEMHKKVGFIQEGRFREQYFNGKDRIDVIRLGMLASEWTKNSPDLEARIAELDMVASQAFK